LVFLPRDGSGTRATSVGHKLIAKTSFQILAMTEEVRFAVDSPLEGDGFELPVPREKGSVQKLRRLPPASKVFAADCRRCVEAHHPDRPGASWVVPEHPKNVYQVTRCGSASLPALSIEGTDLFLSLEPVVTDRVEDIPQIKLMRLTTVVAIHVCPVNWSSAN